MLSHACAIRVVYKLKCSRHWEWYQFGIEIMHYLLLFSVFHSYTNDDFRPSPLQTQYIHTHAIECRIEVEILETDKNKRCYIHTFTLNEQENDFRSMWRLFWKCWKFHFVFLHFVGLREQLKHFVPFLMSARSSVLRGTPQFQCLIFFDRNLCEWCLRAIFLRSTIVYCIVYAVSIRTDGKYHPIYLILYYFVTLCVRLLFYNCDENKIESFCIY